MTKTILRKLHLLKKEREHHVPLVEVQLDRQALLENLSVHEVHSGLRIAPVLKGNAYGHGLHEVASIIEDTDVPFAAVDSLDEAIFLREQGMNKPILVLGFTASQDICAYYDKRTAYTVSDMGQLRDLKKQVKRKVMLHIKINTGTRREGIQVEDIDNVCRLFAEEPHLVLQGIYTHLAHDEKRGLAWMHYQRIKWREARKMLKSAFPTLRYIHLSATPGAMDLNAGDGNILRIGIGLYGIDPSGHLSAELKPVLSVYAPIVSAKVMRERSSVEAIATLPVGYFEGLDKRLSDAGAVMVEKTACPIVGQVSMNKTTIDITHAAHAHSGSSALVLGGARELPCSIESAARMCALSSYETLIHIPQHLRRVII